MTGIIVAVAATVVYNAGFVCEKRALDRLPRIEAHHAWRLIRTLVSSPAWLAGFVMICCGLAMQVVVLSLLPLSVAQPLQACGVVVTLAFAAVVLRERLGWTEFGCVGVIAVAVLLLSLSAGTGHEAGTGAGTHASALPVALAALPVALIIAAVYRWMSRTGGSAVGYGFCAGLAYGYAGLAMKALSAAVFGGPAAQPAHLAHLVQPARLTQPEHLAQPARLAHPAGTPIAARIATDLVTAVQSPYLYVLLGVTAVGMCLFQVALQRGRAAIVLPVSLIVSTGYLVIVGSWLFHERLPASPVLLAMRLAGGLAAIAVPVILAARRNTMAHPDKRAVAGPRSAGPLRCVLAGLGAFLIVAGLMLRFYAASRLITAPPGYSGRQILSDPHATFFNSATRTTVRNATLTDTSTVRGDAAAATANTVTWDSFSTIGDPEKHIILTTTFQRAVFDKRTGVMVDCCGAMINDDSRVRQYGESGLFWPIGTQKTTYQLYDAATRHAWPAVYSGTAVVQGIETYRYVQAVPGTVVAKQPGIPMSLLGIPGASFNVTANRVYRASNTFWVDPRTGVPVNVDEHVFSALRDPAGLGSLTVVDADFTMATATQESLAALANHSAAQISELRTAGPLVITVAGVLLLLAAVLRWPGTRRSQA